jgi:ribose 5-phosphate isomerase B
VWCVADDPGGSEIVRIAIGTDEAGDVPDAVAGWCAEQGHEVVWPVGPVAAWPEVGRGVGDEVAAGRADVGVVCCWTGTGVAIAANKVAGVRAALCTDAATAEGARRWNDANVLALGLRLTTPATAREMCAAFLSTSPDGAERDTIGRVEPTGGRSASAGGPAGSGGT